MSEAGRALRVELLELMARGALTPLPEEAFNRLALRVFAFQCEVNPVYEAFVRNRGVKPEQLSDWREVPTVPTRAFKELVLLSGGAPEAAEAVFRTSGTTGGRERRGEHHVLDLSLYRASALAGAEAWLRPDTEANPFRRVLALLPSPADRPDSSLARMAEMFLERWDDGGGGFLAGAEWEVEPERVEGALHAAEADGVPVLLLGTAFAFAHHLERGGRAGLPAGSVAVETGGYKGRARERSREELYRRISEGFGIPQERIVNEYGMTELLSQFWEPVLLEGGPADPEARRHLGPPWVRTRILAPDTLEAVAPGKEGLLAHFDLANLHSVSAILTEDRGVAVGPGFRVLGRMPGAEPRGCSLAMEALLRG